MTGRTNCSATAKYLPTPTAGQGHDPHAFLADGQGYERTAEVVGYFTARMAGRGMLPADDPA